MDSQFAFTRIRHRTRRIGTLIFASAGIWLAAVVCNFPGAGTATPVPQTSTPFVTPIAVQETAAPTAVEVSPTAAVISLRFPDPQNDGVDCASGKGVSGLLAPEVDIGAAWVELEPGAPDFWVFNIEFPYIDNLSADVLQDEINFLGGIELFVPDGPTPAVDPDWYFNQTGNLSFNFAWNHEVDRLFAWRAIYQNGDWVVIQDVYYPAVIEGNILKVSVPVSQIPTGSQWMVIATNYASCDVLGLKDGLPGLTFP